MVGSSLEAPAGPSSGHHSRVLSEGHQLYGQYALPPSELIAPRASRPSRCVASSSESSASWDLNDKPICMQ